MIHSTLASLGCLFWLGCGDDRAPPYVATNRPRTERDAESTGPPEPDAAVSATSVDAGVAACMPNEGVVLISGDGGAIVGCVSPDRDVDVDCDGFSTERGDCDDCNAAVNPGALDVRDNEVDDDCNGSVDDAESDCDENLTVASDDPFDAARAIGLCKRAEGDGWGVVDATYVRADGSAGVAAIGHGLLRAFGPNVPSRHGERMLVLSSGTARTPDMDGFAPLDGYVQGTSSNTPPSYPVDFPSCDITTADDRTALDPSGLELVVRVPTNVRGFRFEFDFYTYEYPIFVCSVFNDYFVALQSPPPDQALHGNVSFDADENPVSVNIGFVRVCEPATVLGRTFECVQGVEELEGTGYEEHGATGWLETESPVKPGSELTLRFAIWDMGDALLDSTVLIDGFEFVLDEIDMPRTVAAPGTPQ